jgi:hypothetical protein
MNGFLAGMGYMPDLGVGYIFFMNRDGDGFGDLERTIMSSLIPDSAVTTAAEMAVKEVTVDPAMAGWYRSANSRQQISSFAQKILDVIHIQVNDTIYLYQPLFESPYSVYPISDHTLMFETEKHNFTPIAYIKDKDGSEYVQTTSFSGNYVKTGGFWVWFDIVLSGICLVLMASSILAALVWIPLQLLGKKPYRFIPARVFPFIASLCFAVGSILLITGMNGDMMENLGNITLFSFGFYLFMILFAVFSGLAVMTSLVAFGRKMNRLARVHSLLISLACVTVTVYFLIEGIVGLRTWAY